MGDHRVICEFRSKRNRVLLVRTRGRGGRTRDVVVKCFGNRDGALDREAGMLRMLGERGVPVPEIYHAGGGMLILEFIPGELALDLICREERLADEGGSSPELSPRARGFLEELCRWFELFYDAVRGTGPRDLIRGDVNLRNFISNREGIYGLDFEGCIPGARERDIGRLCAFTLTYDPAFTPWKRRFADEMADLFTARLTLDPGLVRQETERELRAIARRRGTAPIEEG